jgi:hypothetical protein
MTYSRQLLSILRKGQDFIQSRFSRQFAILTKLVSLALSDVQNEYKILIYGNKKMRGTVATQ